MSDQEHSGGHEAATPPAASKSSEKQTWSNNKLLIALLPPTAAVLVAAAGMWQSDRADRNAAEEAEKARLAAEAQAEADRAAEAEKAQEVIQREQDLRAAELLLPRYETLVTDIRAFQNATAPCLDAVADWPPEPGFAEACELEAKFNAVILSVDKALIVSGDQGLRDAAIDVEEDLGDALVASYDALGATEAEAEQAFSEFDDALGESEESLNELIAVVQELVTLD